MQLKNCKVELRLISTNHGALSPNGNDNDDAKNNNIISLSKTQVTLSAKDNQKLSKLFRKGFERSVYWNEYKTNIKNKNTANEYRYFLNLKLFIQIKMAMVKWIKPEVMNYQKVLLKIVMLSSMERTFMTNAFNTYKMTQRKKQVNNRSREILYYYWALVGLWLHEKPL